MIVSLTIQANKINSKYRNKILALIKESIRKTDAVYKDRLYPQNENSKIPKPFTFSLILPNGFSVVKKNKDTIFELNPSNNLFEIRISSSDEVFSQKLYDGLRQEKEIFLGNEEAGKIKNILAYKYGPFDASSLKIKFLSPILLEDKEGKPIFSEEETELREEKSAAFNLILNEVEELKSRTLQGRGLKAPLTLIPIASKKRVVKHFVREFKTQTGKEMMYFTALDGTFILKGDVADLNNLVARGMGLRTGQGFGMFEVIETL